MKVLVTDDDADSRELVRYTLATQGIQVIEAAGGAECLERARSERPDAILLDVMMPFMDGPSTLAALRADPATASIPVVLLTASVMPAEVGRLEELGARAVISKPFDPFVLPDRVREILGTMARILPAAPAGGDDMAGLRAQFVRRSEARLEAAARVLARLREAPEDRARLQELMRFFHSLAGVGTSFGFPRLTAVAKEGELECLALLRTDAAPTATEIENWSRLLGALAHELARDPVAAGAVPAPPPAGMATRVAEVLLVSPDAAVADALAPLLLQEGHAARSLATRADAERDLGRSLPDALIVDAELPDGSGYAVIDHLRRQPGGEGVAVLVLGPRSGFLDKVEAIHAGADAYFDKPVDWQGLMRRLLHLLE
ncbi:MAG TPA: response regulator, partial [Vicinamibacteria bacterium]|nr:response regulator [Vicinamibacteria bacterium]